MKKSLFKILALALAITVLTGCFALGAGAAEAKLASGSVNIHTGVRISVDGKEFVPVDSDGAPVEVFLYNGTTYLPVRGISNLFGLGIEWDNETKSVYLGSRDGKELAKYSGTASAEASPFTFASKTITVHTGVSIYYNDEYFHPTDSEGFSVEVFLYNGTTYLPVRAISQLMNAGIDWDQTTKTVLLSMADKEPEVPAEPETPQADIDSVVKAAEAAAKKYTDSEGLVMPYYRYYIKVNAVLEVGLEEVKTLYMAAPGNPTLEYMLSAYVMGYEGYEKEFGTYIAKAKELYDFAKTLTARIKSYAADGYSADELEKLATNTSYLNDNLKYFQEYLNQGAPERMLVYFRDNASAFGSTDVVARIGEIEVEY